MATLKTVIVPAKALKDGRHKVRIALAHDGETRYILTDITVDSKEFKNGCIVKRPDASMLNTKLRGLLQRYQEAIDAEPYLNGLTCSELVSIVKNGRAKKHRTLESINEEYLSVTNAKASTVECYRTEWKILSRCISASTLVSHISATDILSIDKQLRSKYANMTIRSIMGYFRTLYVYAQRCGYIDINCRDPFQGYTMPTFEVRENWLSPAEVRAIRDVPLRLKSLNKYRDLFMLSYYLGGINLADLLRIDFSDETYIKYERLKTNRLSKGNKYVEFAIPVEAQALICKYRGRDGLLDVSMANARSGTANLATALSKITKIANVTSRVTYYSARKSFAQHAFSLGVSTPIIDYILGHTVDKGSTALYSYITVTPDIATNAVRKVLDNLNI